MGNSRSIEAPGPIGVPPVQLHLAIVYASDGVRFVAAAGSPRAARRRVSRYVAEHAEALLWPEDARRVEQLLGRGCEAEAIETYFRCVGDRWDIEKLYLESVEIADG